MGFATDRFKSTPPDEVICSICFDVFDDPVQRQDCEHTFCRQCILEALKTLRKCPECRGEMNGSDLVKCPRLLFTLLSKLRLSCDFKMFGCDEYIAYDQLSKHAKSCPQNPEMASRDVSSENDIAVEGMKRKRNVRDEDDLFLSRNIYRDISVFTEDSFRDHKGSDLFDLNISVGHSIRVTKSASIRGATETVARYFNQPMEGVRLWPLIPEEMGGYMTMRVTSFCVTRLGLNQPLVEECQEMKPVQMFAELADLNSGQRELKPTDRLLYDPWKKSTSYCGFGHIPISSQFRDLVPMLNTRAGYPPVTAIDLYEEVKPNLLKEINNLEQSLDRAMVNLRDGNIIVFQRTFLTNLFNLPMVRDYFEDLFTKRGKEITFRHKFENLSQLRGYVFSPTFYFQNMSWRIKMIPSTLPCSMGEDIKIVGFFLYCDGDSSSRSWSFRASGELKLVSREERPFEMSCVKQIKHTFLREDENRGFKQFVTWTDMIDPEKGFIKNDCIIFEATLRPIGEGLVKRPLSEATLSTPGHSVKTWPTKASEMHRRLQLRRLSFQ